jgi:two-component system cell cycle sensor histidine kinase/response regulator CckA
VKREGQLILIVDDEISVRRLVARVLQSRGFSFLEAQNGLEAVQLYGFYRSDIALVITDAQMPVMDGLEAIDRMRELSPGLRVILVSGAPPGPPPPDCALLRKPFTPAQLLAEVDRALAVA